MIFLVLGAAMLCVNCGKANADNFRFCQFCGTPMKSDHVHKDLSPESLPQSTVTTPASLDDWFIDSSIEDASLNSPIVEDSSSLDSFDLPSLNSGNENLMSGDMTEAVPGRPHPSYSGSEYSDIPKTSDRICQKCGAVIPNGHRFCGNCGSRFESHTAMPAVTHDADTASTRRSVERVSFIAKRAAAGPEYAAFSLFHVNDDGSAGEAIPLYEGENIIGRTSSCLLSTDRFVNPKHVRIICEREYAIIEDCDSLNGVFLRICDESITLLDGDVFRIGEELMSYHHGNSKQIILKNRSTEHTALIGGEECEGWGYLRLIVGAFSEGSVYRLNQPSIQIGRTQGDILFPKDGFVSGSHAILSCDGNSALLTDLHSSNGTFVRLKTALRLDDATFFLIGNQLLCIQPRS